MHLIGNEQAGAAEFLDDLSADKIVLSPRTLRLERGRPGVMTAMPMSDAVLPPGSPPVPVWCKLLGRDGTSVSEVGGHWRPSLVLGPTLALEVPGPGRYHLELHINAGRPGARVLKRFVFVSAADEEAIAADEGERMHAAAGGDHSDALPSPTVTTYRDMLAAVLAAQRFTQNGDAKSYAQALQMLEPVADRLYAIYPELLEQRSRRGFGRNVVDQRFGGARDGVRTWIGKLNNSSGIATAPIVDAFQAAETEIKMGTGEPADLSELRAVDKAAVTTATVAAVGATAIVVAPIAASAVAAVGAELSTSSIGASLYTWAVANPQTALVLSEFLVGMGLGMADQGPENYFKQIETNEDLAWAVMQTLMDLAEARAGMGGGPTDDSPPRQRGERSRTPIDSGDFVPGPEPTKRQKPEVDRPLPPARRGTDTEHEDATVALPERSKPKPVETPELNRHVHEGEIETNPMSPYLGKWNGKGLHTWEALEAVVKRDGFKIKEVTENPRTRVRRVSIERVGVHPRSKAPVSGVITKTIYPKDLTPDEIESAAQLAFKSAQAGDPSTKLDPVGKKQDGSPNIKRDGSPADGFFEATAQAGEPPRDIKIQGWFKEAADGSKTISSHAPAFEKSWPVVPEEEH